jgi:hypothetical protein
MKNTIQKLQKKKLTCPHCDQTFNRSQGLAGHIRYKHAERLPSKTAQPKAKNEEEKKGITVSMSESFPAAQSAPVPVAVPNIGAHEHLKTALEALTQRKRYIDEELVRMEALQAEKETIRKQIDALNLAMQAFDVGITGLSRDSNLISVGKSQELEKLPLTVTLTEKPTGGNSAPPRLTPSDRRLKEGSRLKVIERIINDLGKRPTTRQMAQLLAREGFEVSHVQVFKDYRTLKSKT